MAGCGPGRSKTKGHPGSGLIETMASEEQGWAPVKEGGAGEGKVNCGRQLGMQTEGWRKDSATRESVGREKSKSPTKSKTLEIRQRPMTDPEKEKGEQICQFVAVCS